MSKKVEEELIAKTVKLSKSVICRMKVIGAVYNMRQSDIVGEGIALLDDRLHAFRSHAADVVALHEERDAVSVQLLWLQSQLQGSVEVTDEERSLMRTQKLAMETYKSVVCMRIAARGKPYGSDS